MVDTANTRRTASALSSFQDSCDCFLLRFKGNCGMEPTRLASIAMGTRDMDCVYHAALYELEEAAAESGNQDQAEMLQTLVRGKRLRDISDLPFELAI